MKLAVILLIVLSLLAVNAAAEVKGIQINPKLINQNPDPVEPGDDVELRFRIDNNLSRTVESVEVELLPKYPFTLFEPAVKNIGSLDASQKAEDAVVVKYTVAVDKDADEGAHEIFFRYRVGDGGWRKVSFDVNVESAESIIGVVSVDIPEQIKAGKTADVNIRLKNFGKSLLKDVRVSLDLNRLPLSPTGTSNERVISSISAGAFATANFQLVADADVDSGHYKTDVIIKYLDDSGVRHVQNSTIGIFVYDEPEYVLALKEAKVFVPNSNGDVVLSVSNIGPSEIRFMTMELLTTRDYSVISSPNVYLGNLEADDFETAEFTIRTADIKPKDVNLKVRLTYKDSLNQELVKNEVVKLPLYSKSDAKRFGLITGQKNLLFTFLGFGVQIILAVFIIFMLIDCWKNHLPKYKKVLWTILILTGIGSVLYYFIARRKK